MAVGVGDERLKTAAFPDADIPGQGNAEGDDSFRGRGDVVYLVRHMKAVVENATPVSPTRAAIPGTGFRLMCI